MSFNRQIVFFQLCRRAFSTSSSSSSSSSSLISSSTSVALIRPRAATTALSSSSLPRLSLSSSSSYGSQRSSFPSSSSSWPSRYLPPVLLAGAGAFYGWHSFLRDPSDSNWMHSLVAKSSSPTPPPHHQSTEKATRQFTRAEVKKHAQREDCWVIFQGAVYDVTAWLPAHPGGSEKVFSSYSIHLFITINSLCLSFSVQILWAAGSDLEPWWDIYRIHYSSPLPMEMLEKYKIGVLAPGEPLREPSASAAPSDSDLYKFEPQRHPSLVVISREPFSAETPATLLTATETTPKEIFFIRNHFPVPPPTQDPSTWTLVVDPGKSGSVRHPPPPPPPSPFSLSLIPSSSSHICLYPRSHLDEIVYC